MGINAHGEIALISNGVVDVRINHIYGFLAWILPIKSALYAVIAQLVEYHFPKVGVAESCSVYCSIINNILLDMSFNDL